MKWLLFFLPAVVLLLAAGCADSTPPTSPQTVIVTGNVVIAGAGSLENAMVVFESPEGSATGNVDADGNFSLNSVLDSVVVQGAKPGVYKVLIHPPPPANVTDPGQAQAVKPIELPDPLTVESKVNHFTLKATLPTK